ncbi:MAG TPA: uracil-DNA glycosylase [Acidimicrobiales bacterium]|nr:uracil-DNA glycosylase [Acidimicrobiales bacterium]
MTTSATAMLALLEAEALGCVDCRLAEGRTKVVFGVGNPMAPLVFVGEGPGRDEDLAGEPFVGRSGRLLDQLIAEELAMRREDCYIANVVKCRPPNNRDPLPDEVAACHHFLADQLGAIAPKVVVTLGNFAARALLHTTEGVTRLRGRSFAYGEALLVPTFHPAAALRGGGVVLAQMRADLVRAKHALAGGGVPGGTVKP